MAGAYYEKIARINLTTGEIRVEPLDLDLAHKFIGGRGLGTKMLYDEGIAAVDPLSPENKLIYITGPMTGAAAPSTGRYMVCTKSPLTGMIACSNSGGIWGAKLKYAGWDAIIVEGEAPDWTYINIVDDKIELLDAREYCGVMSEEMDEKLRAKHGAEASVLNIGPAGEKKVLLAAIMNDKDRAAGRSGVGAVMGSKKLKAIVVKATRKALDNIADLDALKVATKNAMEVIRANPVTGSGLRQLGTAVLVNIINNIGAFPTKNWQESYYEKGEDISGETLAETYLVKPSACHRCPIACGRVVNVNGKVVGGPEYEPLWAYGGNCGNNDLNVIDECNMLCNEYGLDAISVPCTIAAAMELYQRGYIKEEECAGVPLEWGSTKVRGYMISPEVLGLPQQLDRTVTNEKAAWVKTFQDLTAVIDSMGHCLFTSFAMGAKEYTDLLNAATGTSWSVDEVLEIGDRIYNIERMFNKAAGMKPEDDRLPKRLLEEPVVNGPSTGMTSQLPLTLPQYYEARGWVNAFPTDETLKKLGLDECIGK